jgi:putative transposase
LNPRPAAAGASYDNALAESVIGLFKTEVILHRGPWRGFDDVEIATLEWVWWFNHHRLREPLGTFARTNLSTTITTPRQTPSSTHYSRNELSDNPGAIHVRATIVIRISMAG